MLYLKQLRLEYVRCYGKSQIIDFTKPNGELAQWTVILGNNGTGKTTILRSIVALLPTPISFLREKKSANTKFELSIRTDWNKLWNIKHKDGEENSYLELEIVDTSSPFSNIRHTEKLSCTKLHKRIDDESAFPNISLYDTNSLPPVFCFAYGANRKMATKSLSGDSLLESSVTLFDEEALLQNSEEYLLQLDYETAKLGKDNTELEKVSKLLPQGTPLWCKGY